MRLEVFLTMEAMEVDSPVEVQGGGSGQPVVAVAAVDADVPHIISDSGSSTEVDEDDDSEERQTAARVPPRLPATWAFSQRAVSGAAAAPSSAHGAPIRRRLRASGCTTPARLQRPLEASQSSSSELRLPAWLNQSPAAPLRPVSESDDEEEEEEEERDEEGAPAAAAPVDQAPPASPHLSASVQQAQDTTNSSSAADGERTETQNQVVQPVAVASASVQSSHGEEGEGDSCTICFEAWTTAGEHRLSALRCGHLFGFTCIQRWLKAQGAAAKCPQCNKKAKRSDIVLLYAPKLRALDNSEQESLKKSLEEEQSLRRKAELESAQYKLKLQVVTNKYGQAQQELQELRALMAQTGRSSIPSSSSSSASTSLLLGLSQRTDGSRMAQYSFSKAVLVSQAGGSRVLSYCEPLSCLLASQPSPHSTLVPGCGVKKVSVVNMKASQYVPIHSKQIRGLSFNRQNDSLLLSAALDNTIKLTSNYVYAGLSNGSVLKSLRHQRHQHTLHVQELQPLRSSPPVSSRSSTPHRDAAGEDALYSTPVERSEDGRGQNVQDQVVAFTPSHQLLHLLSVGQVVVISDEAHHCSVVSANFTIWLVADLGTQSCVIRVNSRGLRTQPWGEPVLRVMTLEVFLLTRTDCGLSVRKSNSQLHRGVLKPRSPSLPTRCCGMIVLNAELKSRNNIRSVRVLLLQVSQAQVKSGADGILCGAVLPVGKLEWVECGGEFWKMMWSFTSLSKFSAFSLF
ncbi:hypothetical protein L3Q82_007108 [Scortum barcoo]|uniref:Uncharacterized protein n=1 Tax=Scortum barcoo TaxID=214431 RepID=A0ACB8WT40_9TELE|nr:hypothetical protein L3Q82_007108 [Scortum barcoo]